MRGIVEIVLISLVFMPVRAIGVRGVFLQKGGISKPVAGLLQLCRGGANAGL